VMKSIWRYSTKSIPLLKSYDPDIFVLQLGMNALAVSVKNVFPYHGIY
jgi:hypothetical protein